LLFQCTSYVIPRGLILKAIQVINIEPMCSDNSIEHYHLFSAVSLCLAIQGAVCTFAAVHHHRRRIAEILAIVAHLHSVRFAHNALKHDTDAPDVGKHESARFEACQLGNYTQTSQMSFLNSIKML
jgi:hypothetical protein